MRADLVKLRDKLDKVRTTIKAPPSNDLSELRTKVNSLERALKKQDSLETKLLKIEEAVLKWGEVRKWRRSRMTWLS